MAKTWFALRTAFLGLLATIPVGVGVVEAGNQFENAAKAKKGVFYLKINLPYVSGRHSFGTYKKALVICTSEGLGKKDAAELGVGWYHMEGKTLSLRINDPVKVDDVDWDGDENKLDIEMEGTGRAADSAGIVAFRDLQGPADFERCWDEVFSPVSIETKYDWPADIKQDVLARKVRNSMTREQVLVALGNPDRVNKTIEDGKEVETWIVQRGEGTKMGFWGAKVGDARELGVRFIGGKVVGFDSVDPGSQLKVK